MGQEKWVCGGDCDDYSRGRCWLDSCGCDLQSGRNGELMALIGYFRIGGDDFALFDLVDYVGEIADVFFDYRLLD